MEGEVSGFFFTGVEAADTGSNDNANAVFVNILVGESGIGYGLTCSHQGLLSIEVKLTHFFAVKMISGVEVLNFAGKLRFELRGVEMCDRSGTAFAFNGCGPCRFNIVAQGSDCAKAGYYYSFKFHLIV